MAVVLRYCRLCGQVFMPEGNRAYCKEHNWAHPDRLKPPKPKP